MTDPTHPKFAEDADDAEGHIYIDSDSDVSGRPEQAVTSPGPDSEDTEGHRIILTADGPAPDGFRARPTDDGEDDTEGHRVSSTADGPAPDGFRARATDDGEDDTEGHRYIANADDTEGDRAKL